MTPPDGWNGKENWKLDHRSLDQRKRNQSNLRQKQEVPGSLVATCGDTTVLTGQARFSSAVTLMNNVGAWNENEDNEEKEVGSFMGAKLAAFLWIFSKAVKKNWSSALGEERRKRLIQDMNRICNRVGEEHVWVSEFHLAVQEQKILEKLQYDIEIPCVWKWCLLWFAAPTR